MEAVVANIAGPLARFTDESSNQEQTREKAEKTKKWSSHEIHLLSQPEAQDTHFSQMSLGWFLGNLC